MAVCAHVNRVQKNNSATLLLPVIAIIDCQVYDNSLRNKYI